MLSTADILRSSPQLLQLKVLKWNVMGKKSELFHQTDKTNGSIQYKDASFSPFLNLQLLGTSPYIFKPIFMSHIQNKSQDSQATEFCQ